MRKLLLIATLLFSSISFASDYEFSKDVWKKAIIASGDVDDMEQRSMMFLHLYHDSNKNFKFALSVSHLTLGIERSSYTPKKAQKLMSSMFMDKLLEDMNTWGRGLRSLNRDMFQRLYFSYEFTKEVYKRGLTLPDREQMPNSLRQVYDETNEMYEDLALIHEASLNREVLDQVVVDAQYETFVNWEHVSYLQAPLEKLFDRLGMLFSYSLRNVPYRVLEKLFINPLTGMRTTINLKCFEGDVYLRTSDFLDATERVKQARRFYNLLKGIDWNPDYSCFKDEYYISKFDDFLYRVPEVYTVKRKIEIFKNL